MTAPGEYSWGAGLTPPPNRDFGGGGYVPTAYDRLRATRLTDRDNPTASEQAILEGTATRSTVASEEKGVVYSGGDLRAVPSGIGDDFDGPTPLVSVAEMARSAALSQGQHRIIDPSKWNKGHESDGEQDGSGAAWRASVPPWPVT